MYNCTPNVLSLYWHIAAYHVPHSVVCIFPPLQKFINKVYLAWSHFQSYISFPPHTKLLWTVYIVHSSSWCWLSLWLFLCSVHQSNWRKLFTAKRCHILVNPLVVDDRRRLRWFLLINSCTANFQGEFLFSKLMLSVGAIKPYCSNNSSTI